MLALPCRRVTPREGNLLITVGCLVRLVPWFIVCLFTEDKGWLAFDSPPQGNLADMGGSTAGKSWIREVSKCATLERKSSQWDVLRHESHFKPKNEPCWFEENTRVYESENLPHWSYFWFKLSVTAEEFSPTGTVLRVRGKGKLGKFVAWMCEAVPVWAMGTHTGKAGPGSKWPPSPTVSLCLSFPTCQGGKVTLTLFWKVMWQAVSIGLSDSCGKHWEISWNYRYRNKERFCQLDTRTKKKEKTFWHAIAAEVSSLERSAEGISQCPLFIWTPPHASVLIQHSRDSSYCVKIKCTYR